MNKDTGPLRYSWRDQTTKSGRNRDVLHPSYLVKRTKTEFFVVQGWSYATIARELGRHRTAMSREYGWNEGANTSQTKTTKGRNKARRQA
jgi:hypothetical protein